MMRALVMVVALSGAASALEPIGKPLAGVRRIYVEPLGTSDQAILLRDMVVASIQSAGVFKITEDADRADAILRGSAEDQAYTDQHHSSDTISAGLHGGGFSTGKGGGSKSTGANLSENESSQSSERRHEASASVRLVNREGDVIWSTTQESLGAKFKSASADVAEKILRRLMDDLQKARSAPDSASTHAGMPTR